MVAEDGREPGARRPSGVVAVGVLHDREEGLLERVLRRGGVGAEVEGHPEEVRGGEVEERGEVRGIPGLAVAGQALLGGRRRVQGRCSSAPCYRGPRGALQGAGELLPDGFEPEGDGTGGGIDVLDLHGLPGAFAGLEACRELLERGPGQNEHCERPVGPGRGEGRGPVGPVGAHPGPGGGTPVGPEDGADEGDAAATRHHDLLPVGDHDGVERRHASLGKSPGEAAELALLRQEPLEPGPPVGPGHDARRGAVPPLDDADSLHGVPLGIDEAHREGLEVRRPDPDLHAVGGHGDLGEGSAQGRGAPGRGVVPVLPHRPVHHDVQRHAGGRIEDEGTLRVGHGDVEVGLVPIHGPDLDPLQRGAVCGEHLSADGALHPHHEDDLRTVAVEGPGPVGTREGHGASLEDTRLELHLAFEEGLEPGTAIGIGPAGEIPELLGRKVGNHGRPRNRRTGGIEDEGRESSSGEPEFQVPDFLALRDPHLHVDRRWAPAVLPPVAQPIPPRRESPEPEAPEVVGPPLLDGRSPRFQRVPLQGPFQAHEGEGNRPSLPVQEGPLQRRLPRKREVTQRDDPRPPGRRAEGPDHGAMALGSGGEDVGKVMAEGGDAEGAVGTGGHRPGRVPVPPTAAEVDEGAEGRHQGPGHGMARGIHDPTLDAILRRQQHLRRRGRGSLHPGGAVALGVHPKGEGNAVGPPSGEGEAAPGIGEVGALRVEVDPRSGHGRPRRRVEDRPVDRRSLPEDDLDGARALAGDGGEAPLGEGAVRARDAEGDPPRDQRREDASSRGVGPPFLLEDGLGPIDPPGQGDEGALHGVPLRIQRQDDEGPAPAEDDAYALAGEAVGQDGLGAALVGGAEVPRHAPGEAEAEGPVGGGAGGRLHAGRQFTGVPEKGEAPPRIHEDFEQRSRERRALLVHDDAEEVEVAVAGLEVHGGRQGVGRRRRGRRRGRGRLRGGEGTDAVRRGEGAEGRRRGGAEGEPGGEGDGGDGDGGGGGLGGGHDEDPSRGGGRGERRGGGRGGDRGGRLLHHRRADVGEAPRQPLPRKQEDRRQDAQRLPELLLRPVEVGAHRGRVLVARVGDGRRLHAVPPSEDGHAPVGLRQRVHGRPHPLHLLRPLGGGGGLAGEERRREARGVRRPPHAAAGLVDLELQDADEPRGDRPRRVVAVGGSHGGEEGLLERVLRRGRIRREGERHPEEGGGEEVEEGAQRRGVPVVPEPGEERVGVAGLRWGCHSG